MFTNADATLYLYSKQAGRESYRRIFVENVFWDEVKQANIVKSGQRDSDSVLLVLPLDSLSEELRFAPGEDLAVKGQCNVTIDCTDQKAMYESLKALQDNYRLRTIMTVDEKLYGGEPHYELSCQ